MTEESMKTFCIEYLEKILIEQHNFSVHMHAAEALISHQLPIDIRSIFPNELQESSSKKIGVLRMLARQNLNDSNTFNQIGKEILEQFKITNDEQTQLFALESLGKLGLHFQDPKIINLANSKAEGMRIMAQWVLSNSGSKGEVLKLTSSLFSESLIEFKYVAYALRFKKNLSHTIIDMMLNKLNQIDDNHPFRVYLLSSLWLHLTPSHSIKGTLMKYLGGNPYERYEVYEAMSIKKDTENIPILKEKINTEGDEDLKIAVCNAYLSNI